ncbi:glycerol-3-phosphate dehydrogenase (NAD+) (plasmid) [Legionella adelaidensis]|uniref:Glycerol-3-phosphate dehydrogenase [NAD(P)+] n=1 Tax=Legionella adelaidensis TaxID=45056 RepID=A0A0W0R3A1_9GAMM|nr:NAD(P)H-dependent glycerol-3-phosphate dehydrogenase [Legionella adelaidensis]KTC65549.1 glycerol-3-phosphate dehydrogenase (NAD+) [Legionella adelaidensis]VEH84630.1 glycerol-3-phosphate dehydrogenase (NAD+) [Legionella adelaidensis]
MSKRITILGAGSWGTAVAIHLARKGYPVDLWARDLKHVEEMQNDGCNSRYLPHALFPKCLRATHELQQSVTAAEYVIIAVPSHAFATVLTNIPKPIKGIAWLTKGLDPKANQLLSQIVATKWGKNFPFAIIAGPSFAREVSESLPTALVVAGNEQSFLKDLQSLLHGNTMRVYISEDYTGVQLCGAVKNVLAIACGISDGLQYGANAKAALITRGLAEMSRLGHALGAKAETFMGLAGVGDLVLTCTDNQSRNRRFGLLLGQGEKMATAESQIGQVVEGKYNAAQVCALAKKLKVEMPICEQVNQLLNEKITAQKAVENLMQRPLKEE